MSAPVKLDLEDCFQNSPPFQLHLANNENYILTCDALLKVFSKTSKQAVEAVVLASKATKAVAESVDAIGKFESQIGEDQTGIIGNNKMNMNFDLAYLVQLAEILKAIEFDRKEMVQTNGMFSN